MPGPRMGPRPIDFDEELIRQSPTFLKWLQLDNGQKLRYACRDFAKGHGDDEERLMRRIMIARRNNLRDHDMLKQARAKVRQLPSSDAGGHSNANASSLTRRRRAPSMPLTDTQYEAEMDKAAVEATKSYRTWLELPNGAEFLYNNRYIKGRPGHDWQLRKNIWRRMRYRRENKKMVQVLKTGDDDEHHDDNNMDGNLDDNILDRAGGVEADHHAGGGHAAASMNDSLADEAVEAAMAATVNFKTSGLDNMAINTTLDHSALDVASKLAAAAAAGHHGMGGEDEAAQHGGGKSSDGRTGKNDDEDGGKADETFPVMV